MQGRPQQLSLYADDIILYVSSPETSIPPLLELINHFGSFSGYTINWDKSEIMPITPNISEEFLQAIPLKKAYNSITYLGVIATKKPSDLLQINWQKKIDQLKQNIEFWKTLPISMAGRINAIKMVVLPRFLYLFQTVPAFIPLSNFKQLNSIIIPFIWNYKTVRISQKHLSKPQSEGGFGLPHFKAYYWAAHLNNISWWKKGSANSSNDCPEWLALERSLCVGTSLPALLNSPNKIDKTVYGDNFVIKNTLRVWKQIRLYAKAPNTYIDSPICQNHAFAPGLNDPAFNSWTQKGIREIKDLYLEGHFASFEQLCTIYNIPVSHFYKYLQIRDYVRKNIPNFETFCSNETLEEINNFNPHNKGAISYFYRIVQRQVQTDTNALKSSWEAELGEEIQEGTWTESLASVHKCSINSRHNLIQFKTIHRLYYSKDRLHKIFPDVSSLCNRCKMTQGTLAHSFWSCPKLIVFWKSVFECFSKAFGKNLEPSPLVAILGVTSVLNGINKFESQAISLGMVVAKKMILLNWKLEYIPTYEIWIRELMNVLHLEKLRFSSNNRTHLFTQIWNPVIEFFMRNEQST